MSSSQPDDNRGDAPAARKFGERLRTLIASAYPDERKRPGYARLAKEIREKTGGTISGTYLWELATEKKSNVTLEQLDVLAQFFGVPPAYFFDDQVTETVNSQLALLTALRDAQVQGMALRAIGLSQKSLKSINEMIERVRELEGLPDEDRHQTGNRNPHQT
ncbi:hypothetical protein [Streptomyces decoyicus]